jgi:hypothetical protein
MSTVDARLAHDVAARGLEWLHTHRARGAFDETPSADLDGRAQETYKALGETALAASLVRRSGAAGTRELALADALLDFCWEQLGHGGLLYERQLRHPLLTDPLETYALFARAGRHHPALHELLTHRATLRGPLAAEVLPNRRLAVANATRVAGLDDSGTTAHALPVLTRATWLGSRPEPWLIDWMTGYAVTHTVFHLTDWGRLPGGLPEDLAAYLALWLPVWTDIWAEIAQWDLVGELMIVGCCLPEPYADPADFARLASIRHGDGMVPRDGQPVATDPGARFADNQHTTVVAVIAGVLALTRALDEPAALS